MDTRGGSPMVRSNSWRQIAEGTHGRRLTSGRHRIFFPRTIVILFQGTLPSPRSSRPRSSCGTVPAGGRGLSLVRLHHTGLPGGRGARAGDGPRFNSGWGYVLISAGTIEMEANIMDDCGCRCDVISGVSTGAPRSSVPALSRWRPASGTPSRSLCQSHSVVVR